MKKFLERETLGSRVGFLLLAAGCAVGLGNIWRFPYIAGLYGGASFVFIYLFFLVLLGLPLLIMELSVGRAAQQNIGKAFRILQPSGSHWHVYGHIGIGGNYLLMMFYTTVTGWILFYFYSMASGRLSDLSTDEIGRYFDQMLQDPWGMISWMALAVFFGFFITGIGLRRGVERVSKFMMVSLFVLMMALAVKAVTLKGALDGLNFYLLPDMDRLMQQGLWQVVLAAMGQAFFTLSVGLGGMAIFGSYINKDRSLPGESVRILGLDASVAIMSGLIIFPACFAFGVSPDAGPGLLFVTLPNIFNQMGGGYFWGTIFFLFMSFAALSTVIAVFENIVSYWMDVWRWSRRKASWINAAILVLFSLPAVLGFNVWSQFEPLGPGTTVLELEDMLVSTLLLPVGALVFIVFTTSRYGWGWSRFIQEVNTGTGLKLPVWTRFYVTWILPVIIIVVLLRGFQEVLGF